MRRNIPKSYKYKYLVFASHFDTNLRAQFWFIWCEQLSNKCFKICFNANRCQLKGFFAFHLNSSNESNFVIRRVF